MSLQVWLPLNESLENQGLSSIIMANSSITWDSNGKIGKCAIFSGNTSNIIYNNTTNFNYTDNFSWSVWIKTNYTGTTVQYAFTNGRADAGGYGYGLECASTAQCRFRFGNSSWLVSVTGGVWTHLVFTKSGTNIKLYRNGVKVIDTTFSGTLPTYSDGNGLGLGCFHYTSNIYPFYGSLNDFRIYDHCLSPKEVKELSKGLVLHYKLDGNCGGSNNLLIGSNLYLESSKLTRTASKSDDYIHTSMKVDLIANTQYTMSFYTTGTMSSQIEVGLMYNNGYSYYKFMSGTYHTKITDNLYYHNETFTVTTTGSYNIRCDWNISGETHSFWNFKIEQGTTATTWTPNYQDLLETGLIEYDRSGYNHDGTITGTLTTDTDTPRYNGSYKFSNSSYISHPALPQMHNATYNFWVKASSYTNYNFIYGQLNNPAGGKLPWLSVNTEGNMTWAYFGSNSPNYTRGSGTLSTDVWHMLTYTWNDGIATWYVDGVQKGTATYTTLTYIQNGVAGSIGDSYTGTNWNGTPFIGNLSDFRIYATALSADDIKELYNTSTSIDNNGNLFTKEIVEV